MLQLHGVRLFFQEVVELLLEIAKFAQQLGPKPGSGTLVCCAKEQSKDDTFWNALNPHPSAFPGPTCHSEPQKVDALIKHSRSWFISTCLQILSLIDLLPCDVDVCLEGT